MVVTSTGVVRRNHQHLDVTLPKMETSESKTNEQSQPNRIVTRSQTETLVKPPERLYSLTISSIAKSELSHLAHLLTNSALQETIKFNDLILALEFFYHEQKLMYVYVYLMLSKQHNNTLIGHCEC